MTDVARQIGLDGVQYLVLALLCEFFVFFWFSIGPKLYIEISVDVLREMSYYVDISCFCYVPGYLIIVLNIKKGQK